MSDYKPFHMAVIGDPFTLIADTQCMSAGRPCVRFGIWGSHFGASGARRWTMGAAARVPLGPESHYRFGGNLGTPRSKILGRPIFVPCLLPRPFL